MESHSQAQGEQQEEVGTASTPSSVPNTSGAGKGFVLSRRQMLGTLSAGGALVASGALSAGTFGVAHAATQTPALAALQMQPVLSLAARKQTLIGIGYETWFMQGYNQATTIPTWNSREATPVLGLYRSDDPKVIQQHAEWISQAGYDFIMVDWSNNLSTNWTNGVAAAIIAGTDALFKVYAQLHKHPKIALLIGTDDAGAVSTANFNAQIAEIKSKYLNNPAYQAMLQTYQGKPLLSIFRGPAGDNPPTWTDPDFTVRYMTAYHEIAGDAAGQWSWIDRTPLISGPQTKVSDFGGGVILEGEKQNSGAPPAITTGHTLGQSFTFTGKALTQITALLAIFNHPGTGATMTLYSGTPETTLTQVASQVFTNLADNAWITFNVPPQPAGKYYLELSNPVGTPTWWYYTGTVVDVGGTQYIDRKAQPANQEFTFTFFGTSNGSGGLNGWQVGPGWSLQTNGSGPFTLQAPEGTFPSTKGSTTPGSLDSPAFAITGTFLNFYAAGSDKADNSGQQNYFLLKDAATGEVLRQAHTPGTILYFTPISWDVRDLKQRQVIFEAHNVNATADSWMAFCNVTQVSAEFSVAAPGTPGNVTVTGLSGYGAYDSKARNSGATLVQFMQQIFNYQPDVMLIQQWNEFGQPDQDNVPFSNDIEPTVMKHKLGNESDGWDFYYLNLVTELIRQYRNGDPVPHVQLDTLYP